MSEFKYDSPKKEEIVEFLNYLKRIISQNPNYYFNSKSIYSLFCDYGLSTKDYDKNNRPLENEHLFKEWQRVFAGKNNIQAFQTEINKYFFQFTNGYLDCEEYIKLYVPIDYEHLFNGVNILFDFLAKENIIHASKVSKRVRSDNVIIRLSKNDLISAKKIIDFINNNSYLSEGIGKVNPFVPTVNRIGFMIENGNSYNMEMAEAVCNYLSRSSGLSANIEDFSEELFNTGVSPHTPETFDAACKISNKQIETIDKEKLFYSACMATFQKYGIEQLKTAIIEYVSNGSLKYFTNGTGPLKYRNELKNSISTQFVINYMAKTISQMNMPNYYISSNEQLTEDFCSLVISSRLTNMLDEICSVTLLNYGKGQLKKAITEFINSNITSSFSRKPKNSNLNVNYRELLKYYNSYTMCSEMQKSLIQKGKFVQGLNVNELIDLYVNVLGEYRSFPSERNSQPNR